MTQLTRPEISIEGRYWSYETPFTLGGRVSGEATGIGLDGPIRIGTETYSTTALSFLSFVYPGRRWTLAVSRHQSAKFENLTETQGLFTDDRNDDPQPICLSGTDVCRYPDIRRSTALDITSTTLSFAYRLSDTFSLGLGASYYQGELRLEQELYPPVDETLPQGLFGANAYVEAARLGTADFVFGEGDWGVNLGFLWFLAPRWSLGGFSGTGIEVSGPFLDPPIPEGTVARQDPAVPLKIPNVFGLGLAYSSKGGSWTASVEWDRVLYSEILESIGRSDMIGTTTVLLDDADELRLGLEYVFLQWSPLVAIRGGVWRNPDHTIRSIETEDPLEIALLPGGEDDIHFATGLGIVFKDLQIDLAVDFSDQVDTAALSLIFQF